MWTMLVFFGWIIWFWLLIVIFGDLFRRGDISGWGKAGWTILLIVLPFIGVLIYLIAQGRHVGERRIAAAEFDYASSLSTSDDYATDQIIKAKQLLDSGAISDDEYQALKRQALASAR
jgi:hypothetical protein